MKPNKKANSTALRMWDHECKAHKYELKLFTDGPEEIVIVTTWDTAEYVAVFPIDRAWDAFEYYFGPIEKSCLARYIIPAQFAYDCALPTDWVEQYMREHKPGRWADTTDAEYEKLYDAAYHEFCYRHVWLYDSALGRPFDMLGEDPMPATVHGFTPDIRTAVGGSERFD